MEIPSSAAGIVKSLKVSVGDKVSEGVVLLELEADDAATAVTEPRSKPRQLLQLKLAAETAAPTAVAARRFG